MMLVGRKAWVALAVAGAVVLGACGTAANRAPVEDRGMAPRGAVAGPVNTINPASLPGAENAGKPGYYTVQPGEGLMKIARDHNQNWRDIVRWNNLDNPDRIEAGQVLRVEPPPGAAASPAATSASAAPLSKTAAAPKSGPASAPVAATQTPASRPPPVEENAPAFIWPAAGAVIAGYDEAKNKGLDIAGKAGEPVLAAADGEVIYVGSALRSYGNLVMVQHDNSFLTAYAHNQTLLVKEKQKVKKGQKIAEMGNTDADRVELHFEIRRSGKPVDPVRYLPQR